jgi:hypothetical protein
VIEGKRLQQLGRERPWPAVIAGVMTYEEYLEKRQQWSAAKSRARLYGLFPDEALVKLFPADWLDLAQKLGAKVHEIHQVEDRYAAMRAAASLGDDAPALFTNSGYLVDRPMARPAQPPKTAGPYVLGVDVAQGGDDLTVWCVLGRFGVRLLVAKSTPNTAEIAGLTVQLVDRFQIAAVVFDSGGGGRQIADRLREAGREGVDDIWFGSGADDKTAYINRRTELYGQLREALRPTAMAEKLAAISTRLWPEEQLWPDVNQLCCLALPPDEGELREDLAVLPYLVDSEGRMRLPRKDSSGRGQEEREPTVRRLLDGRSPDRGDALVLACAAWKKLQDDNKGRMVHRPLCIA